jgi:signal peptidase I
LRMLIDSLTFTLLKNKVQSDGYIDLPAYGNSMFPFIRKGNLCRFTLLDSPKLIKGDVVLFHSVSGQLVAHRLSNTKELDGKQVFILKGDTNLGFDQPVKEHQIIGVLAYVQKGDRRIHTKGLSASFWGWLILSIPILSEWLRIYINKKEQVEI